MGLPAGGAGALSPCVGTARREAGQSRDLGLHEDPAAGYTRCESCLRWLWGSGLTPQETMSTTLLHIHTQIQLGCRHQKTQWS